MLTSSDALDDPQGWSQRALTADAGTTAVNVLQLAASKGFPGTADPLVAKTLGQIASLTGSSSGLEHRPLPQDDPRQRKPDITKARTMLGWQPEVDLSTGIERTAQWFRELLDIPVAVS